MSDAANPCPICGQPIAERPRGSRHGHPPKTCSEECRKERNRRRGMERYQRIKGTPEFKEAYAARSAKLRAQLQSDTEMLALHRAYAAARVRQWRARAVADPLRHEELKAASRAHYRKWRAELESDPVAWEAHMAKCRDWYASLTPQEKARIYGKRAS